MEAGESKSTWSGGSWFCSPLERGPTFLLYLKQQNQRENQKSDTRDLGSVFGATIYGLCGRGQVTALLNSGSSPVRATLQGLVPVLKQENARGRRYAYDFWSTSKPIVSCSSPSLHLGLEEERRRMPRMASRFHQASPRK